MIGAQWYESDTLLQKLLQNWASMCLDVQFVPPLIRCLQRKAGTDQDETDTRVIRGWNVRVRVRLRACPCACVCARVDSHMSHNPAQCPILCTHERIYVHMRPLIYTCHHSPAPASPCPPVRSL